MKHNNYEKLVILDLDHLGSVMITHIFHKP